jgi:antimicrobial peptide system SdpA family protein
MEPKEPWAAYRPNALLAQLASSALIAAVTVVYTVHGSMSANALELPFEEHLDTVLVLPEGWAFFTKDPKEPRFLVFARAPDGSWSRAFGETPKLAATFGFSRRERALGVEAGLIASAVTQSDWKPCPSTPAACLALGSGNPIVALNTTPHPTLCGPIGLVQQDRVPWAWAKSVNEDAMPSRVVRVNVQCRKT